MAQILIIDDSAFQRRKLGAIATHAGHVVREACSGQEGLDALHEERPDCVLLDVVLPELTGVEVLRALRHEGVDTPVIVITADVQARTRDECLVLGAHAVLNKPVAPADLQAILNSVLGEASGVVA